MRKNRASATQADLSILAVDDDKIMTLTLQAYFQSAGYRIDIENDPQRAVEKVREGNYDILLLDFLMSPICGDKVVARIREFNTDLYIILLTGHKSMAPPIQTIRELEIQGYYEKSDRFDQLELLVESCAKSIRQMRTIRGYRDGLTQIVEHNPGVYRLQPLEDMLRAAMTGASDCLKSGDGFIYLPGQGLPGGEELFFGIGDYENGVESAKQDMAEVTKNHRCIIKNGRIIASLVNESQVKVGVLSMAFDSNTHHEKDVLPLFDLYAKQVSSAVRNALLHRQVNDKNEELAKAYDMLNDNYMQMITALRTMVDARDVYTRGHSDRVSFFSVKIAKALGKDKDYCEKIRVAGLFHDVGKVAVSDGILLKEGRLTPEEYTIIKHHAEYGIKILSGIQFFHDILPAVAAHHERIDGTGYPNGLKGEEIPEEARIISIADAFDAMTSHRRYRKNLVLDEALEQIREGRGTQFDARIADVFLEMLSDYDVIQREMEEIEKETNLFAGGTLL
ncbi:MAG: HD domain-containing response regulator [Christensenella sp.]|nr:HD domain-containing response regulator [Christensenella sp.]